MAVKKSRINKKKNKYSNCLSKKEIDALLAIIKNDTFDFPIDYDEKSVEKKPKPSLWQRMEDIIDKERRDIYLMADDALLNAKIKHPIFAYNKYQALSILMEEVGEIAKAINDNEPVDDIKHEIYDTITVCIRMLSEVNYGE